MVLTSNRRRTAGITALFAAILLILTTLFVISPASAEVVDEQTCKDLDGYDENFGSDQSGDWGSIEFEGDNGPLVLTVNEGYAVALCLKKGDANSGGGPIEDPDNPYIGPLTDVNVVYPGADDMSHYSYRLIDVAEPEAPTFVDADCDDPDASAVNLPETTGVDYAITGTVAPGETVTVTATAQDGYVIHPDDTTSWEHTFAEVPEVCGDIAAVTAEPTFTDPTCDVNTIGLVLPDTEGVTYTVTGDEEPGGTVVVTATADDGYVLADDAATSWEHTYGELATDCETETDVEPSVTPTPDEVEVLPNVIEKPAPTPAPAAQPAAQVAAQELPATGFGSTELLLLALLLMGLGASALLAPERGREY